MLAQQFSFQLRPHRQVPSIAGLVMRRSASWPAFFSSMPQLLRRHRRTPPDAAAKKETHIDSDAGPLGQALEGFRYVWGHRRVLTFFPLSLSSNFGWSYSGSCRRSRTMFCTWNANGYGINGGRGVGALAAALTVASAGHILPDADHGARRHRHFLRALALSPQRNLYVEVLLLALSLRIVLYFSTSNTSCKASCPTKCGDASWNLDAHLRPECSTGSLPAGLMADLLGTPANDCDRRPHLCCRRARHAQHNKTTRSSIWPPRDSVRNVGGASVPRQLRQNFLSKSCDFLGPPGEYRATKKASDEHAPPPPTTSFRADRAAQGIIYKIANSYCRCAEYRKDLIQEIVVQLWNLTIDMTTASNYRPGFIGISPRRHLGLPAGKEAERTRLALGNHHRTCRGTGADRSQDRDAPSHHRSAR